MPPPGKERMMMVQFGTRSLLAPTVLLLIVVSKHLFKPACAVTVTEVEQYGIFEAVLHGPTESESDFISILSVIIIFFLTIMVVKIIGNFLTKIIKFVFLGLVNKIIGSLFGILKSFLVLTILIFIFSKLNEVVNIVEKEKLHQSIVYSKIEKTSFYLIGINYTENGKEE